jgi:uncharacterized protein (TIGR04255 family)
MTNPLQDPPPAEVLLENAPLQRVLAVVAFSPVLKIADPSGSGIAGFQDVIRKHYPTLSQEVEQGIQVQFDDKGQLTPPMMVSNPVWRFTDKSDLWRATLTRETIAIETQTAYANRQDFLDRLKFLTSAVQEAFEPAQSLRVGLRYLNLIDDGRLAQLDQLVRAEFLAFCVEGFRDSLEISTNISNFRVPEGNLVVKWGVLPPNLVHDPNVMRPSPDRRWYLDLDASNDTPSDFDADSLYNKSKALTERIYTMFRWAVKSEFLESCVAG